MLSTLSLKWSGDEEEARLEKWDQQTNQQTNCTKATPKKKEPRLLPQPHEPCACMWIRYQPKRYLFFEPGVHHFVGHQTNSSHGPNNNTRNPKWIRKGTQLDLMYWMQGKMKDKKTKPNQNQNELSLIIMIMPFLGLLAKIKCWWCSCIPQSKRKYYNNKLNNITYITSWIWFL
jgi:hypothetical protein